MNVLDNSKYYRLGGRNITKEGAIFLSYSASYIEFKVKAKKVTAKLLSHGYDDTDLFYGWVYVFVDNADYASKHFAVATGEADYDIYEGDGDRITTIRIMKGSETVFGNVAVKAIEVDGEIIEMEPSYKKLIEFVGDSITCGYGFYGICDKDVFTTAHEDPWNNYAGKLARKLGADYQSISWSGNGVVSHWMEKADEQPRVENFFLQDLYPYADAELERRLGITEYTPWNFERKADLVVINLGTNDSSFTDNVPKRNAMYAEKYTYLVDLVRKANPEANIVCTLGVMIQCLTTTLAEVVEKINAAGDKKVYFVEAPLQSEADGMATDGHPSPVTHEKLSTLLATFIKDNNLL